MRDAQPPEPGSIRGWKLYVNRTIARDLSTLTRYYDRVIQWLPRTGDTGVLLDEIDAPGKFVIDPDQPFPDLTGERELRSAILINGAFNHDLDIESRLRQLHRNVARTARLLLVLYNPYLRWLYFLANKLGVRKGELPGVFLTRVDLESLARLGGFEIVRQAPRVYCPFRLLGLGILINRVLPLIPLLRWLSLTYLVVLRPLIRQRPTGLSCVIPARNEKGNIENAFGRFPELGCAVQIIFVEGHSSDGTWDEILRVAERYSGALPRPGASTKRAGQGRRRTPGLLPRDRRIADGPRRRPDDAPGDAGPILRSLL